MGERSKPHAIGTGSWLVKFIKKGLMEDLIIECWGKNSDVFEKARKDMMGEGNSK
jgi:hypothetical protein